MTDNITISIIRQEILMEDEKKVLNEVPKNKPEELDEEKLEDAAGGVKYFVTFQCPACGMNLIAKGRCPYCGAEV